MKQVSIAPTAAQQRVLDANSNPHLQALVSATPAQVAAYVTAHVSTIADARTLLIALALGLRAVYLNQNGS